MAKTKHHTELGIKRRRQPHSDGVQQVILEVADGDTAWHPFSDDPIPGPALVMYHLHDNGDAGVIIGPPLDPNAPA